MKKLIIFLVFIIFILYTTKVAAPTYNTMRPYLAFSMSQESCISKLQEYNIEYTFVNTADKNCPVSNLVSIKNYPNILLSSAIKMSCTSAVNLYKYLTYIKAKSITHLGTYNCRTIRNTKFISEHGFGTAIDISRIDGLSIKNNWKNKRLKLAAHDAEKFYVNVITPDNNAAHYDHLHLDSGLGITLPNLNFAKMN